MRHALARTIAVMAAVLAGILVILAFIEATALQWGSDELAAHGLFSLPLMVVGFTSAGTILAWFRPRNSIGWLMSATGLIAAAAVWASPSTVVAIIADWPLWLQVGIASISYSAWSLWLVLIPLALLLFPTGRLDGTVARVIATAITVSGAVTLLLSLADPAIDRWVGDLMGRPVLGAGSFAPLDDTVVAGWVTALPVVFGFQFAALLGVIAVLAVRFIRGDAAIRQQLFWILLAALLMIVLATTSAIAVFAGPSFGMLSLLPLPIGVMIAIIRVNLFDVRLVFSRALAWTLLTGALIAAFFGLVAVLGILLVETASAVIAALVVALAFDPLRRWLQRIIDRLVYGRRSEPVYLVELLGAGISRASDLQTLIEQLRGSLKLRWLAVRDSERIIAADGTRSGQIFSWPLRQGDHVTGLLEACPRTGEHQLSRSDRQALTLLSPVLEMLLRVTSVSDALADSRGRIVEATEDERRRLQRDLHDGVASALGGIAFKVEGIRNGVATDPHAARDLLTGVHDDVVRAGEALRGVIHDLRPPELDTLGLVGALREATASLAARSGDRAASVTVRSDPERPQLPAAIEVASYRIGVEAVSNALRHSSATEVTVDLVMRPSSMSIRVQDNAVMTTAWTAGVGLKSMRDRTELLGGSFHAGPSMSGGTVDVAIPVHARTVQDV